MVETRKVGDLKPHPANAKIYGDGADADLVASVAKGILVALLITYDDRVIAGHRRLDAALQAGLIEVPVAVFESRDELAILEALVEANRQRVKSNEQFAREAEVLLTVERERARMRREATQAKPGQQVGQVVELVPPPMNPAGQVVELVPPPMNPGKARDIVGEKLGASGRTVEKAVAVAEAIDQLEAEGKDKLADELRAVLNDNGVGPAHAFLKELLQREAEGSDSHLKFRCPVCAVRFDVEVWHCECGGHVLQENEECPDCEHRRPEPAGNQPTRSAETSMPPATPVQNPQSAGRPGGQPSRNGDGSGHSTPAAGEGHGRRKQESPPVAPLVDAMGLEVPKQLQDVFATRLLVNWANQFGQAAVQLGSAAGWNQFLLIQPVLEALQTAKAAVEASVPWSVHARCQGKGCAMCRGMGWLPRWRYEEMSAVGDW